jgi:L-aspartate oxidase
LNQFSSQFDVVVVGSGAAGLYAALCLPESYRVGLITKDKLKTGASDWAQGGIAAAIAPDDSSKLHFEDTLKAGAGLCIPEAVQFLVDNAAAAIASLVEMGVAFDRHHNQLAMTLEAAHSRPRVLHAADTTGRAIVTTLTEQVLARPNIEVISGTLVLNVWRNPQTGVCQGISVIKGDRLSWIEASAVILATGGGGQVFSHTTNPQVSTGDGVAIAARAGAILRDLEFFQFHPTALTKANAPHFLISEAVRGEGAHLIDLQGKRFAFDYHPDGELAPRDIVSRAIYSHLQKTQTDRVYLDLTPIPIDRIRYRFPNIIQVCQHWGIDVFKEPIPVAPAAHYWMGGVAVDTMNRTSIPGLYAIGETASTGVHGANRLASNSLLECVVYAAQLSKIEGVGSREQGVGSREQGVGSREQGAGEQGSRGAGEQGSRGAGRLREVRFDNQKNLKDAREAIEALQIAELDNYFKDACAPFRKQPIDNFDPNAAIIYTISLPERLEVIVSLPNGRLLHHSNFVTRWQVEQTLEQLQEYLKQPDRLQDVEQLSQIVYSWLIAPFAQDLEINSDRQQSQIKTLVFVLDALLKNIPMSALYDGKQYLLQRYAIAVTPGLRLLKAEAKNPSQRLEALITGISQAIQIDKKKFTPLEKVEAEVKTIQALIPGETLLNSNLTKNNLEQQLNLKPFSLVHIATHGQFSSDPDKTFILLWNELLNVKAFNNIFLSGSNSGKELIDLLVLSACETALGDKRAGLGLAGIAVRSGTRSTLATLWDVNDESTSQVMIEFYRVLSENPALHKAEALRQAQLKLWQNRDRDWQVPFFWASYVLVGEWI